MQQATNRPRSTAPLAGDGDNDAVSDPRVQRALDPDLRHRMISEAAYYLYMQRGCEDGGDMDDWMQAEVEIDLVMTPRREEFEGDDPA